MQDNLIELVTITTVYGDKLRVRKDELEKEKMTFLRIYNKRGNPLEPTKREPGKCLCLHRGNIKKAPTRANG